MIIGLFGLSGSGKSYVTEKLASTLSDTLFTKASDLIKERKKTIEFGKLTNKIVNENQTHLIKLFHDFCEKNKSKNIIIELHNIVETPEGVVDIEKSIFEKLQLDTVFYLAPPAEKIYINRKNDVKRERKRLNIYQIESLQKKAIAIFSKTFEELNIPQKIIYDDFSESIIAFIESNENRDRKK